MDSTLRTPEIIGNKPKAKPPQGNVVLAATPNTVPVIPADWAKLGAQTGYKPKLAEDLKSFCGGLAFTEVGTGVNFAALF